MSNKRLRVKHITKTQVKWRVVAAVILAIISLVVVLPNKVNAGINWANKKANLGIPNFPDAGFNLGLDLQGGAHLIYKAKTENIKDSDKANSVEGVRDVIERRVRGGLGVGEPLVQTTKVGSEYRVIVELPGVTDVNQAIKMIGETPILEFKEEDNTPARELTAEEKKQMDDFNKKAEANGKKALTEVALKNADFAKIASNSSEDDKTKNNGGDMGYITSDVYPEIFNWASTHKDGDISRELIKSGGGINILKRVASRDGEIEIKASHLLICYSGAQGCESATTKSAAKAKIEDLKKQATAKNFIDLTKKNSTEPGASEKGGDLGWFKKGDMVESFEKTVFAMSTGTISDVVETQFGYHLIYKENQRSTKEYQVSRIFFKTKSATDIIPPKDQWKSTGLSGKQLKRAEVSQDQRSGQIQVALQFDSEGTKLFGDITKRNKGKLVAIFLDGQPISIPRVNEAITSGSAVITGSFSLVEAKLLAQRLNSGALPVAVELISQQKIDATLGADSLTKSLKAGIIGFLAVILFMILYYRLAGVLAVLALGLYATLSLAIFKIIGVTLTLSGIAGFILSIGMAVDANVLIFERLKEELRLKKSLRSSMEESFIRAWPSIRDSNVTTLISCAFLIWLGGGFVQGFAVTLAIGVLVSMFTAITITRNIMRLVCPLFKEEGNWLFFGYTKQEIKNTDK